MWILVDLNRIIFYKFLEDRIISCMLLLLLFPNQKNMICCKDPYIVWSMRHCKEIFSSGEIYILLQSFKLISALNIRYLWWALVISLSSKWIKGKIWVSMEIPWCLFLPIYKFIKYFWIFLNMLYCLSAYFFQIRSLISCVKQDKVCSVLKLI